jgi:hypothetical protein
VARLRIVPLVALRPEIDPPLAHRHAVDAAQPGAFGIGPHLGAESHVFRVSSILRGERQCLQAFGIDRAGDERGMIQEIHALPLSFAHSGPVDHPAACHRHNADYGQQPPTTRHVGAIGPAVRPQRKQHGEKPTVNKTK